MMLCDQQTCIREAVALHECLRKLSFTPDEIFVSLGPDNEMYVTVKRDAVEGSFKTGKFSGDKEAWERAWADAAQRWNDPATPEGEREHVFYGSQAWARKTELVVGLVTRGFHFSKENGGRL